jgi:hypothetical protein
VGDRCPADEAIEQRPLRSVVLVEERSEHEHERVAGEIGLHDQRLGRNGAECYDGLDGKLKLVDLLLGELRTAPDASHKEA